MDGLSTEELELRAASEYGDLFSFVERYSEQDRVGGWPYYISETFRIDWDDQRFKHSQFDKGCWCDWYKQ